MDKLRIAFFIDALKSGAGTENQVLDLLRRLDRQRFETYLFTLREPVSEAVVSGIPVRCECLGLGRLRSLSALRVFWKLVRTLRRERIDIAMIYFADSQIFVPPAAFLARHTVCVVNRRDMGYWYTPGLLRALRWANKFVHYFLVNARAVKEMVASKENFPRERVKVIYNALAVKGSVATQPLLRRDLGLPDNTPVVALVANLRPVKRVDRFIDMAALVAEKHRDVRFLILGGGELHDSLTQQAAGLGLTERIVLAGSVDDVGAYLHLCDIGVLTSESEGLSSTLIEYSYHRLPVVAFDTGGNAEVIAEGTTGFLVSEGDLSSMAAKVLQLLNDPILRKKLGESGRQRVEKIFDPVARLSDVEEFFATVAGKRGSVTFD
jgi:glycosyltransferase involved in cell wall biosynthesis